MKSGGAFLTSREIFSNPIWQNVVEFRLFFLIYGNAIFAEEGHRVGGITLERGQWLRSIRNLQKDLEYIENRAVKTYSTSHIKRAIDSLVKQERIKIEVVELGTLFTVLNYASYQGFERYQNRDLERTENAERTELERNENSDGTELEQRWNNNNNGIKDMKAIKAIKVNDKDILSDDSDDVVLSIINFLNERANKSFRDGVGNRKEIKSRLFPRKKAYPKYTPEECKLVIDWKVFDWGGKEKFENNLNPVTLFRDSNFDRYLVEAREELKKRGKDFEHVIQCYRQDNPTSPFADGSGYDADGSYFGHLIR